MFQVNHAAAFTNQQPCQPLRKDYNVTSQLRQDAGDSVSFGSGKSPKITKGGVIAEIAKMLDNAVDFFTRGTVVRRNGALHRSDIISGFIRGENPLLSREPEEVLQSLKTGRPLEIGKGGEIVNANLDVDPITARKALHKGIIPGQPKEGTPDIEIIKLGQTSMAPDILETNPELDFSEEAVRASFGTDGIARKGMTYGEVADAIGKTRKLREQSQVGITAQ